VSAVQTVDWWAISPLVVVGAGMLVVLLVQALVPGRRRALDALTLLTLAGSGAAVAGLATRAPMSTFCADQCSYETGGWVLGLQAVVLASAAVCLLIGLDQQSLRDPLPRTEFHALLLASVAGALALSGARDLFTMLVALETASLPMVGLVGLRRTGTAAEAATKLLLVSVVSFGLALLGVALIYSGAGTVHVRALAAATPGGLAGAVTLGAALTAVGIGYKVAALPFGLWVPDVYAGSPVAVAALLSTVSKAAGLAALAVVVSLALPSGRGAWFAVVVAVTMTLGNVVALTQTGAVRLLAWSTIGQAGWVLLPLAGAGSEPVVVGAATTYLIAYCAATLTVFVVVCLVTRYGGGVGHPLSSYRALARTEPVAGSMLALALLSLAGLPPGLAGLIAKAAALRPVIDEQLWWLAVVAALNVALALAYYLRWLWILFAPSQSDSLSWRVTVAEGAALSLAGGMLVCFTVFPAIIL
jgi:NADH-quinone oxidoreductase subunit N